MERKRNEKKQHISLRQQGCLLSIFQPRMGQRLRRRRPETNGQYNMQTQPTKDQR